MPFCFDAASPCLFSPSTTFLRLPPGLRVHAFSSRAGLFAESRDPTFYEILNVPVTATTKEIKRQFYSLSLVHHPDKNPTDPTAHSKFASIVSAYQVLSDTAKRAGYDRDHNIQQSNAAGSSGLRGANTHRGSYVGSRPPSGLSKRRGPFRGPPPSFYAHGGYGSTAHRNEQHNHAHHRHPKQETSSHGPFASAFNNAGTSSSSAEDPTSFVHNNPIHHFDASSHFRTQSHEDARRRLRRMRAAEHARMQARAMGIDEDVGSSAKRFFVVMGLVVVAMIGVNLGRSMGPQKRKKSDGSSTVSGGGSKTGTTPHH